MSLLLKGFTAHVMVTTGTSSVEAENGKVDSSKQVSSVQRREFPKPDKHVFLPDILCYSGLCFYSIYLGRDDTNFYSSGRRSQNNHNDKYVKAWKMLSTFNAPE